MKLKPPNFNVPATQVDASYTTLLVEKETKIEVPEGAINQILETSGLKDSIKLSDDSNQIFKKHLSAKGGDLENVAQQVVNIMCRGETEASRLRAAEFIAKIQGVQLALDEEKVQPKETVINIINQFGSQSRNLVQFVMPKA